MKSTSLLILMISASLLFIGCASNTEAGTAVPAFEPEVIEEELVEEPEPEPIEEEEPAKDPVEPIDDSVWAQAYYDYLINQNTSGSDIDYSEFNYSFIFLNDDNIPEIYIMGYFSTGDCLLYFS